MKEGIESRLKYTKIKLKECLLCDEPGIGAHSIQRKTLESLANNGEFGENSRRLGIVRMSCKPNPEIDVFEAAPEYRHLRFGCPGTPLLFEGIHFQPLNAVEGL